MQDPDSTNQLLQTIKARQLSIDLLVHCAHVFSEAKLILQVSPSAFHSSLVTNLVPLYELMRGVSRSMYRQRFGRILLMGSLISVYGGAGKIRYIVEKSAFDGLAQGFSAEYSSAGVTTCVLHPSLIDTDTIRERVDAELLQQVAAASAGGRLLSVAEVAAASLTLIDPTQALNSGQLVELSGGARW
jgi:3-oxoacyl-[acyl-carrier protein] reductase